MKSGKTAKSRKESRRRRQAAPKKAARRFHAAILGTYVLAIVWTTLAHAAVFNVARSPTPAEEIGRVEAMPILGPTGRLAIRAYVQKAAKADGVDPRVADWIVTHESQHHPEATGDGGESRGLWQINKEWHPEVSDACAYDVQCSTRWSLARIRAGYVDEWSTWKYRREWFEDCPF